MPQLVGVQILTIKVNFEPETVPPQIHMSGDVSNGEIRIPQGITMIILALESSAGNAEFPTYPIEWLEKDGVKDTDQPGCFMVQRLGSDRCMMVDFNSHPGPGSVKHKFNVVVTVNGKTYGSDPTIINEPPGGGD